MSIHVCKCNRNGVDEYHLRYPGMSEEWAQRIADKINYGWLDGSAPPHQRIAALERDLAAAQFEISELRFANASLRSKEFDTSRDLAAAQVERDNWKSQYWALSDRYDALDEKCNKAEADLAAEQAVARYLCDATRFKMSFDDEGNVACFGNFADALDGRWVALVAAENDAHMKPDPQVAVLRALLREVVEGYQWMRDNGYTVPLLERIEAALKEET